MNSEEIFQIAMNILEQWFIQGIVTEMHVVRQ